MLDEAIALAVRVALALPNRDFNNAEPDYYINLTTSLQIKLKASFQFGILVRFDCIASKHDLNFWA